MPVTAGDALAFADSASLVAADGAHLRVNSVNGLQGAPSVEKGECILAGRFEGRRVFACNKRDSARNASKPCSIVCPRVIQAVRWYALLFR